METLGIIAGNGKFPVLVLKEARKLKKKIIVCGIEGEAESRLQDQADVFHWVKIGELKKLVKYFSKDNVSEVIMAGKVEKVRLFQENVKPDFEMVKVLMKTRDFKDDSLLGGICDYLNKEGIQVLDSTTYLKTEMPGEGVLGRRKPSREILEDIEFGRMLAKEIAGLDIGQTVVVKKKAILAVEAIEGTDQAIRRGGMLGNGKITVVKVAKPNQDMRFDVPAVGLKTLEEMKKAGVHAFAFEANKTILIDKDEFVAKADKAGITLVGI